MEKNRICGICNKTFASGKAMGGHMRSHYAKLPISTRNINPTTQIIDSSSSSPVKSTSSSSFSDSGSPKRSRRRRPRWIATPESPVIISSGRPDSLSVEEVAMCLVMLSMDRLSTEEARKLVFFKDGLEAEEGRMEDVVEKNRYRRCEVCEKVFKSYQALGGHRAKTTHHNKKMKICLEQEEHKVNNTSLAAADDDDKYKRFHFASYLENSHNKSSTESVDQRKFLDLNFPAVMDEDEGLITTQSNQLHQG